MNVIEIREPGGPEVLQLAERPRPAPAPGEVLIRTIAAGVNRPDIQQRRGLYPPPPGASDLPGLDVAGVIEATGEGVTAFAPGDAVCALVNGGGYAEFCTVPALQCMPIPRGLSFAEAASLPEVFFTAWNNVFLLGRLAQGERLLIQGGTSGVGLAAMQMARHLRGATVYATAGSAEKRQVCLDLGCAAAVDYRGDWAAELTAQTDDAGMDVILDGQAGPYVQHQLDLLALDGRLVLIASHLGAEGAVNFRQLVRRRQTLCGSTLRPRSADYKGAIARDLVAQVWPLLEDGRIVTRLHAVLPFHEVAEAHRILDANAQIGKVVLALDEAAAAQSPG
ncbi:NAD(P)H-quinone oxidoreductase [Oceanicola sp. S124]|uniref:NAD(P)H-quinone oxidoreductase n=1 Tax=Oceanicola sp. S124 TaxID=1042378 RepID=UPI000255A704|nr:NAD(P)H-quinone oxidoreductase [Oceanicola sp. S124]